MSARRNFCKGMRGELKKALYMEKKAHRREQKTPTLRKDHPPPLR